MGHSAALRCELCDEVDVLLLGGGFVSRTQARVCEACSVVSTVSGPVGEPLPRRPCPACGANRLRRVEEHEIETLARCRHCGGTLRRDDGTLHLLWD